MNKTVLFFVLYVCCLTGYAQDSTAKQQVAVNRNIGLEISAGYSMPLGTYASVDKSNKKSGYATGGWQMQLTFDWMGKKDFGIAIQYTYQKNAMNNASNVVFPNGIPDSVGSGSWANQYMMAGPVFLKTIKRLHLDAKIMGGVIISSCANFSTLNPYDTTKMTIDKNLGTGFAYQISAGVGFAFSSHFAIKFNLGLLGGWPSKNKQYGARFIGYVNYKDPDTGLVYSKPVYSATATYEIKKVVTTLNPSLGLVYRF